MGPWHPDRGEGRRGDAAGRCAVLGPQRLPGADADAAKTVACLGRLGGVSVVIGEMAVELIGVIELALGLGTAAGVEQLPRRELG